MNYRILCLFLLAVVAVRAANLKKRGEEKGNVKHSVNDFHISYTIKNPAVVPHFTNLFYGTLQVDSGRQPKLIDIMDNIAAISNSFRYESRTHPTMGKFITSMNGQRQVPENNLYWMVLREEKNGAGRTTRCYLPTGASTYEPKSGETIVWELQAYDNSIRTCGPAEEIHDP